MKPMVSFWPNQWPPTKTPKRWFLGSRGKKSPNVSLYEIQNWYFFEGNLPKNGRMEELSPPEPLNQVHLIRKLLQWWLPASRRGCSTEVLLYLGVDARGQWGNISTWGRHAKVVIHVRSLGCYCKPKWWVDIPSPDLFWKAIIRCSRAMNYPSHLESGLLVVEPWMVKMTRNTWKAATFLVKVGSNAETAPIIEKILGCIVTWGLPVEQSIPSQRSHIEGG